MHRAELVELYVSKNLSIGEIGKILSLSEKTIFDRLKRLNVPVDPARKPGYRNKNRGVVIPTEQTAMLAEFLGIMLGDGHLSHFQTVVTLGTKELAYVEYVAELMQMLFKIQPTILVRKDGYRDIYVSSVVLTAWLRQQGLVPNKVAAQVGAPQWIFEKREWMEAFVRGFFDTDGSIYRLRFGMQISLTNKSIPLLVSLQGILRRLGYRASAVSLYRVYLTRKTDIERFFAEVRPANRKHLRRFEDIVRT